MQPSTTCIALRSTVIPQSTRLALPHVHKGVLPPIESPHWSGSSEWAHALPRGPQLRSYRESGFRNLRQPFQTAHTGVAVQVPVRPARHSLAYHWRIVNRRCSLTSPRKWSGESLQAFMTWPGTDTSGTTRRGSPPTPCTGPRTCEPAGWRRHSLRRLGGWRQVPALIAVCCMWCRAGAPVLVRDTSAKQGGG